MFLDSIWWHSHLSVLGKEWERGQKMLSGEAGWGEHETSQETWHGVDPDFNKVHQVRVMACLKTDFLLL